MKQKHSQINSNLSDIERVIPKSMTRPVVTATNSTATRRLPRLLCAKEPVQAFTNEVEGHCPVCKSQMKTSVANGIDVYVCMDHRVTMPLRNETGV